MVSDAIVLRNSLVRVNCCSTRCIQCALNIGRNPKKEFIDVFHEGVVDPTYSGVANVNEFTIGSTHAMESYHNRDVDLWDIFHSMFFYLILTNCISISIAD